MALQIAKDSALTDVISQGDNSNPLVTQHPIGGSTETIQLYLFNDNATYRYENVTIDPIDNTDTDESSWLELSADGSNFEPAGAPLSMSNITDSNTPHSFYVRITTPSVANPQNKSDIKIQANGREFAV